MVLNDALDHEGQPARRGEFRPRIVKGSPATIRAGCEIVLPLMEFNVLGHLMVARDGVAVPVRSATVGRLLAVLLCRPGRPLAVADLVQALWGEDPPSQARKGLQVYVHRLRRIVGDERIEYGSGSYRLAVEPDEVDALRFADLFAQARAASRQARPTEVSRRLREALLLWRGEPYAGVSAGPLVAGEVLRLTEQRLLAVEECVAAELDLGGHRELVGELAGLTKAHPYRERLRGQLMLALYRAGRTGEALGVFRETRALFVAELGIEPGATMQRLHEAILRNDGALDAAVLTGSGEADPVPTGLRVPYTFSVPRQLPADVSAFAGRTSHLKVLDGLLPGGSRVRTGGAVISAIAGTAGVGKTALAVHWARRVAEQFPDGQLHIDLRGYAPGPPVRPIEALSGFLRALGVPASHVPVDEAEAAALYRSLMADRRMQVVLDNASSEAQVRPLLPAGAGCLVLVTSRSRLGGLIARDGAHSLTVDVLSPAEAQALLADVIGHDRVHGEADAAAELAELCAYLPLALRIAAANLTYHPQRRIRDYLVELRRGDRLTSLQVGADATAAVRPAFDLSYRAISASAQRLFDLLGLVAGPDIATSAVVSLAGAESPPDPPSPASPPRAQVDGPLAELARAHLVTEHAPHRYTFHDLLRAYATEMAHSHNSDAARDAATGRLLDHYLHTAHAADLFLNPQRDPIRLTPHQAGVVADNIADREQALAWFAAEHRVLLAVIRQAAARGFDTHAWQLAWTLVTFLDQQGLWDDLVVTQTSALEAALRLDDRSAQATAHRLLGRAYARIGSYSDASAHLGHALGLSVELGDQSGQAHSHRALGHIFERQGMYPQALEHARHALELFKTAGHQYGQAATHNAIGWYHSHLGDYEQALAHCESALVLHREIGNRHGEAGTLDSLAYTHGRLGNSRQAIACYQQALDLYAELGDRYYTADTAVHLGDAHHAAGDPYAAREAWLRALPILEDLGHADADEVRAKLRS
jgi:DNA-binding SARP family transcriptional activator/Tfp pilus assembly protein PilF